MTKRSAHSLSDLSDMLRFDEDSLAHDFRNMIEALSSRYIFRDPAVIARLVPDGRRICLQLDNPARV
jgi:hypothetical protein